MISNTSFSLHPSSWQYAVRFSGPGSPEVVATDSNVVNFDLEEEVDAYCGDWGRMRERRRRRKKERERKREKERKRESERERG
jgi:hypothetical protein